jgi:hypothetical protein
VSRAAVSQVVTIYRRDYCMCEVELTHCFGDVPRFIHIQLARCTFTDSAEAAVARANVTAQHERCGPIGPAFKNIWATGFLAYGVKIQALNQLQDMVLVRRITQTDLQPFRLGLAWFRRIAYDA